MFDKFLPESRYARNVITLMTGTSLAQAIPIAISPILTRLYGPADFGVFALYMAVVMIASVLVTGRYELAIILPKSDRDAIHIVALSVLLSCTLSAVLMLIVTVCYEPIIQLMGTPALGPWLYWMPVSTLLLGVYQSLNYWSNRKAQYKRLAVSRTMQGSTMSLAQLASGHVGWNSVGLIGGQLAGQALATSVMACLIYREDRALIRAIRKQRISRMAKKYINFPKYLIFAHGTNTTSGQMPSLLLSFFFSTTVAGFYTLTQRVLAAPMALAASALGDVFRQEASHAYAHTGQCKSIYQSTFKRLVLIGLPPFIALFFTAPFVFSLIFGEQWIIAGEYAQILTPMVLMQFITSPLSSMYLIAQKQKLDLAWQLCLLLLTSSSLLLGAYLSDPKVALVAFSASYTLMYAINGMVSYQLATGRWAEKAK